MMYHQKTVLYTTSPLVNNERNPDKKWCWLHVGYLWDVMRSILATFSSWSPFWNNFHIKGDGWWPVPPTTWRIIPVSKWSGSPPIYKPFRPFGRAPSKYHGSGSSPAILSWLLNLPPDHVGPRPRKEDLMIRAYEPLVSLDKASY